MRRLLLAFLFAGFLAAASAAQPQVELNVDRLASALKLLSDMDRAIVRQTIDLLRSGQHEAALARLSALNTSNPENSSVRILLAYAQLQLGNLLGAFEQAEKAEAAPNGTSYRCYFLGKMALITGNRAVCQREIGHLKAVGDMKSGVRELEKAMRSGGTAP